MKTTRLSVFVAASVLSAAAVAQQPANNPAADASQLEEVVIFARGVARQQQVVLVCPALGSQRIGHAAQEHLPR